MPKRTDLRKILLIGSGPIVIGQACEFDYSGTQACDALLPTVGGQTALNCAMALHKEGVLDRFGVEMIGAKPAAIAKAEDRELFKSAMQKIGIAVPRSGVARSLAEALALLDIIGLPCV